MLNADPKVEYRILLDHVLKKITLTNSEQDYLCSLIKVRYLLPRQYLLQEGEICRHESFVTKGFLRSFYYDQSGNDYTLHFAMPDWWISDTTSFYKEQPALRNIIALEPSTVLQLEKSSMEVLYNQIPAFERFCRIMNENACVAQDQRILNSITMTGAERYEALLRKYPKIEQHLAQKHIASYLGISPVFLSNIRKRKPTKN